MLDRKWEVGATIAAAIALALFLAYHKGKGTPDVTMTQQQPPPHEPPKYPSLGQIIGQDAANVAGFNPAFNFGGNAFDIGDLKGPVYNLVNNVNNVTYNIPDAALVPLNVENLVNNINFVQLGDVINQPTYVRNDGTPSCSCSAPDVTDLNNILQAEHDKFNAILEAIQAIKPVEPATNIYVALNKTVNYQGTPIGQTVHDTAPGNFGTDPTHEVYAAPDYIYSNTNTEYYKGAVEAANNYSSASSIIAVSK